MNGLAVKRLITAGLHPIVIFVKPRDVKRIMLVFYLNRYIFFKFQYLLGIIWGEKQMKNVLNKYMKNQWKLINNLERILPV
jgi:hypothetical protein